MSLSSLEADSILLPEASTPGEVRKLLDAIERRLRDAAVEMTSNEARSEHLYHVVLQCSNIALRANDYRLRAVEGAHAISLDTLAYTVGIERPSITFFQKLRERRNRDLYRGEDKVSDSQLAVMSRSTHELYEKTTLYITGLRPDLFSEE